MQVTTDHGDLFLVRSTVPSRDSSVRTAEVTFKFIRICHTRADWDGVGHCRTTNRTFPARHRGCIHRSQATCTNCVPARCNDQPLTYWHTLQANGAIHLQSPDLQVFAQWPQWGQDTARQRENTHIMPARQTDTDTARESVNVSKTCGVRDTVRHPPCRGPELHDLLL